jgi:hypothetical protein
MRLLGVLPLLLAAALNGSVPGGSDGGMVAASATIALSRNLPGPPARLFISGHSLTDEPFGRFLALLAARDGNALEWDMHSISGSSLQDRLEAGGGVRGRAKQAFEIGGAQPDALLLAEQHTLLESLIWKDTIGSADGHIARFHAIHPGGPIYLFTTWLNVDDVDDPARWLAYERAAAPAWRCVAAVIEARSGVPVTLIPAAEALATLVDQALAGKVAGVSGDRSAETMRALFADDVHLTATGTYFTALVTHGVLGGDLTGAGELPADVTSAAAEALQRSASRYLAQARSVAADPAACRAYLSQQFAPTYLEYVRDARWRSEGVARAYYKWLRFRVTWPRLLQSDGPESPLWGGGHGATPV